MQGQKTYYKGRNGLEYPEFSDAVKYGGGVVAKRTFTPQKVWEPVYDELTPAEKKVDALDPLAAMPTPPMVPPLDPPQALNDYDNMSKEQLKEALKTKGYPIKGNPSEETMREKLKLLN